MLLLSGDGFYPDSSLTKLTSHINIFVLMRGLLAFIVDMIISRSISRSYCSWPPFQKWRKKMFGEKASTFLAFPQVATRLGLPSDLNSFPSSNHIVETASLPHRSVSLRVLLGLRKTESIPRLTHPLFRFTTRQCAVVFLDFNSDLRGDASFQTVISTELCTGSHTKPWVISKLFS